MSQRTSKRKDQHLEIALTKDVSSGPSPLNSSWDAIELPHRALPEISLDEISLETEFLGKKISAPILISSMTGGTPKSDRINQRLLKFANEAGIPMGLGSQRVHLENPQALKKLQLRKIAPKAQIFSNIGAVQFNYGVTSEQILRLVETTEADGLFVHLNPLQEAIQAEGDRNFSQLVPKLKKLRASLKIPIILKETGCGLDAETLKIARDIGFDAVDTSGMGGTHWGYIEGLRSPERRALGKLFRNWGIPSPQAVVTARKTLGSDFPVIASGGIRSGLDIGRALYLGADLCGIALPFLKAAESSEKKLWDLYAFLGEALRVTLFCSSAKNPKELKRHGPNGKI